MEGKRKGQRVVGQRCHTGQQQVREVSDHGLAARLSVVQTHFILCFLKYVCDLIFLNMDINLISKTMKLQYIFLC